MLKLLFSRAAAIVPNQFNKIFLAVIACCASTIVFVCPSLSTSTPAQTAVDRAHLQEASDLINSKHYHRAYAKFKTMAQHGCPFSQCILGIMSQKGLGTKKSASQAFHWFQKSAQQGFADAEHRLGSMYFHGDGVTRNFKLAKQWLNRASQHGVEESKQLLSQIPEESAVSEKLAEMPHNAAWTIDTIHKSWQGYSDVTKQLDQLASLSSSK